MRLLHCLRHAIIGIRLEVVPKVFGNRLEYSHHALLVKRRIYIAQRLAQSLF